jgi:uncharacterized FlaG/YvyC family protein
MLEVGQLMTSLKKISHWTGNVSQRRQKNCNVSQRKITQGHKENLREVARRMKNVSKRTQRRFLHDLAVFVEKINNKKIFCFGASGIILIQ